MCIIPSVCSDIDRRSEHLWREGESHGIPRHSRTGSRSLESRRRSDRHKSGLYTVKTSTGTKYKLPESADVRYGRDVPKIGNEMILLLNEGNLVMDASRKGTSIKTHFVSGKLISINYGQSQMTLSLPEGEKSFKLRPESRLFKAFSVGTPITIVLNEAGEVTCFKVSRTSDVALNVSNHFGKNSALKGFRHLGGEPE